MLLMQSRLMVHQRQVFHQRKEKLKREGAHVLVASLSMYTQPTKKVHSEVKVHYSYITSML